MVSAEGGGGGGEGGGGGGERGGEGGGGGEGIEGQRKEVVERCLRALTKSSSAVSSRMRLGLSFLR